MPTFTCCFCCGLGTLAVLGAERAHAQGVDIPSAGAAGGPTTIYLAQAGLLVPLSKRVAVQGYGFYLLGDQRGVVPLVNLAFKLNRYVTLTPGYLGLFQPRRADGTPQRENRARLAATLTLPLRGLYFSNRSLVERRFQVAKNSTRYRNLLRAEDTVRIGRQRFTVYAYDEVFYDWSASRWTINQTALGLTYPLTAHLAAEAYYLRQTIRGSPTSNIWGLACTFRLAAPSS